LFVPCNSQKHPEYQVLADSVRTEFLHAWSGYKTYAWGHDALKPLSRKPHDWHAASLLMTPVDAFDTMMLMGLEKEAREAKKLILDSLRFDHDIEVQAFEIVIRILGGLISAYELDGDRRFLKLARDLGERVLPIYDSPSGLPYRYVNLRTGAVRGTRNNPAEIGTTILEFGALSRHTGNPVYFEKAKRALTEVFKRRSAIGLVGTWIDIETGEWLNTSSHVGGAIDSYYEYLVKAWLLFGDEDCRKMAEESLRAVNLYVADTVRGELWYGRVDMETGEMSEPVFGSLEAFFPALLCLTGDVGRAAMLQESIFKMWNLHGIEPEDMNYDSMTVVSPGYYLRPEIIESAYYLYHHTGDPNDLAMGETIFRDLVKYCRVDAGYAYLSDVVTKTHADGMESFFLAETLKYLYLLFASESALDFEQVIFNTEAHPIRRPS
ncbi:MAG TPA: glycoside hydrolase family 47 protein, partial [Bacteroidota bacterium]